MNSIIEINQKIEKLFAKNTDKNLKSFAIIIYTEKGWAALMMPAISADSEKSSMRFLNFFIHLRRQSLYSKNVLVKKLNSKLFLKKFQKFLIILKKPFLGILV